MERTQRPALSAVCPEGGRGVPGLGQAPAGGGCWGRGVPGLGRHLLGEGAGAGTSRGWEGSRRRGCWGADVGRKAIPRVSLSGP